ncbi:hypothetical protein BDR07DRAFT_1416113 [Suillus spraguei]|nr:hypothetical protein BDR07DRAFT_1416113 [Suillus spraguei]
MHWIADLPSYCLVLGKLRPRLLHNKPGDQNARPYLSRITLDLIIYTCRWLIWKTSYLRHLLVLFSLGHWTTLALFVVTARASTQDGVCITHFTTLTYTKAVIIYSMLYDLVLLVFTIIGLWKVPSSSTLWKALVKQGVVFFIITLVANVILLALDSLNLDPIMNHIAAMPVACVCTISSNQVVLSLLRPSSKYKSSDSASSAKVPPSTIVFNVLPSVTEAQESAAC